MRLRGPLVTLAAAGALGAGLLAVNMATDPGRQPPATPVPAATAVVEAPAVEAPTPPVPAVVEAPPVPAPQPTPPPYSSGY